MKNETLVSQVTYFPYSLSSKQSNHKWCQSVKWSPFSSPTTCYIKSHIRLTETSWPILLFTLRCQTDSWYWWHCTVTMTDSSVHCSSCLEKENTDYCNILFKCTCQTYWCSETVSHVTPVQYSVSIHMWHILMFWNCITCHSMYNIQLWCQQATYNSTQYHNAMWQPCTV